VAFVQVWEKQRNQEGRRDEKQEARHGNKMEVMRDEKQAKNGFLQVSWTLEWWYGWRSGWWSGW